MRMVAPMDRSSRRFRRGGVKLKKDAGEDDDVMDPAYIMRR